MRIRKIDVSDCCIEVQLMQIEETDRKKLFMTIEEIENENIIEPTAPEKIWTLPNVITMARILLVPLFVVILLSPWPEWFGLTEVVDDYTKAIIATGAFICISCTDWIDGYLARKRNQVSDFGKFMDPLADKILVASALLALVELQTIPAWPVIIILAREFIVSGARMLASGKNVVIAASWYGKVKTVLQIAAIVLFLVKAPDTPSSVVDAATDPLFVTAWIVMIAALVMTVVSMMDYLSKCRELFGFRPKGARHAEKRAEKQARKQIEEASDEADNEGDASAAADTQSDEIVDAEVHEEERVREESDCSEHK